MTKKRDGPNSRAARRRRVPYFVKGNVYSTTASLPKKPWQPRTRMNCPKPRAAYRMRVFYEGYELEEYSMFARVSPTHSSPPHGIQSIVMSRADRSSRTSTLWRAMYSKASMGCFASSPIPLFHQHNTAPPHHRTASFELRQRKVSLGGPSTTLPRW